MREGIQSHPMLRWVTDRYWYEMFAQVVNPWFTDHFGDYFTEPGPS